MFFFFGGGNSERKQLSRRKHTRTYWEEAGAKMPIALLQCGYWNQGIPEHYAHIFIISIEGMAWV